MPGDRENRERKAERTGRRAERTVCTKIWGALLVPGNASDLL